MQGRGGHPAHAELRLATGAALPSQASKVRAMQLLATQREVPIPGTAVALSGHEYAEPGPSALYPRLPQLNARLVNAQGSFFPFLLRQQNKGWGSWRREGGAGLGWAPGPRPGLPPGTPAGALVWRQGLYRNPWFQGTKKGQFTSRSSLAMSAWRPCSRSPAWT